MGFLLEDNQESAQVVIDQRIQLSLARLIASNSLKDTNLREFAAITKLIPIDEDEYAKLVQDMRATH